MDAVTKLLAGRNWERLGALESDYAKPLFAYGDLKCVVGRLWTTVWRLVAEGNISEMKSVKTEDTEVLDRLLADAERGRAFGR